ncbi:MFS family permease [Evansella vedderi]|uniref:MFS family permease n=1 Tax=Evansella vedderi TaxID=38282 RepID=A0ABT9ZX32_9BACI|nr:MFS transporter [Evansella vedderi]MDQ0255794.1 MFS family permease [Evansella vedderi]
MLFFLYAIIIVVFLDTFIQLPIISPYAQQLGASAFLTGMIVAVYSLTNMIGNAFCGHLIDRYGRKKLLLVGMGLVTIILLLYPAVSSGWGLFLIRFIHGLAGGALIPAAFAYLGDLSPEKGRGKRMAFSGASIGIAAIIGPAIGGIISARYTIDIVFYLVAFLFFAAFIGVMLGLKETVPLKEQKEKVDIRDLFLLLRNPTMFQAINGAFALMFSMGILAHALPLKVQSLYLSSAITGMLLSSFGIVALIIFLTPINNIFDKFIPQRFILGGLSLISFALLCLTVVNSLPLMVAVMIVYGIGFSFVFPSMNRIVVDISSEADRGKAFGIFYASFSLGVVFGSLLSGATSTSVSTPFFIGGIVMMFLSISFWALLQWSSHLKMT